MTQAELTRAMNQVRRDYEASKLVNLEVVVIAALVGLATQSWIGFLVTLFGLFALLRVPYLGGAVAVVLSVMWGVFGWHVGAWFHSGIGPQVALAIVGFLIGFGAHRGYRDFWR
jgi:hypothetical protein